MELIVLIGIPAAGKSSFCKARLADTHVRINGDMLGGDRGCEADLAEACFQHQQPLVIDKMNFTRMHREPYLTRAKQVGFLRIGYFFPTTREVALERNQFNSDRVEKGLPDIAIHNVVGKMEPPTYLEGFDRLYSVQLVTAMGRHDYEVEPWRNDG